MRLCAYVRLSSCEGLCGPPADPQTGSLSVKTTLHRDEKTSQTSSQAPFNTAFSRENSLKDGKILASKTTFAEV